MGYLLDCTVILHCASTYLRVQLIE